MCFCTIQHCGIFEENVLTIHSFHIKELCYIEWKIALINFVTILLLYYFSSRLMVSNLQIDIQCRDISVKGSK